MNISNIDLNHICKEYKKIPYNYRVLAFMVTKELLLEKSDSPQKVANVNLGHKIIEGIMNELIKIYSPSKINQKEEYEHILNFIVQYNDGLSVVKKTSIGLGHEYFSFVFSVLLFNTVITRYLRIYPNKSNEAIYTLSYNAIVTFLNYLKTYEPHFQKAKKDYDIAYESYMNLRTLSVIEDEEDCESDDFDDEDYGIIDYSDDEYEFDD